MTLEDLDKFGANTSEGMSRCLNKEPFYLRLVGMGLKDKHFDQLGEAIAAGDRKVIFDEAHALKGTMANLALTPILAPIAAISDSIRDNSEADIPALYSEAMKLREELMKLL